MRSIIRQIELARLLGIAQPTVNRAARDGELHEALAPDGKKLWADHPATLDFIMERIGRAPIGADGTPTPAALQFHRTEGQPPPDDPFAAAMKLATIDGAEVGASDPSASQSPSQGPEASGGSKRDAQIDFALWEIQQTAPRDLPPDIGDLGAMTLRGVVDRFGSLIAMRDAVKALKEFADMQVKQQLAQTRRRELVDRTAVGRVFTPLIDLAFKRLIGEAPQALRQQIVARVLAGGDDLATDVEELIRREVGGILEDCKGEVLAELTKLEEG